MRIVSCFSALNELGPLAEAGADEFYAAVPDLPAFGLGALPRAALRPAVEKAHALGKKIALAVNAMHSTLLLNDLPGVLRRARAADELGVDAFIVSNPFLLEKFAAARPRFRARLHLSSVQPVFNSASAEFFSRYGISRLILTNLLAPAEAGRILAFCHGRGIETEIFDYRFFNCPYVNGRCQLHRPAFFSLKGAPQEASLCRVSSAAAAMVKLKTVEAPERAGELLKLMDRLAARLAHDCAPRIANAASFFDFHAAGVGYLKFGMRHDPGALKARKVRELRSMTDLAARLSKELPRAKARRAFIKEMTRWDEGRYR